MDLFDAIYDAEEHRDVRQERPLADRMRPDDFSDFLGQEKILGEDSILRRMIAEDRLTSMILWGPPGSGKTTLANIISHKTHSAFFTLSAVTAGIKEVKHIFEQAKLNIQSYNRKTILYIDEIHRFNKIQQDAFLPYVENGTIILIGATTENPSFSIISPLLSRCRVFVLNTLTDENLKTIILRALNDKNRGLGTLNLTCGEDSISLIITLSDGDARRALNLLELSAAAVKNTDLIITANIVKELSQRTHLIYDKQGEEHYNIISAFHKSLRGSDPDAALYWLARMLVSGEEPLYVARRMIRFASEDIGNADPQALVVAIAAWEAYDKLGSPEGELALVQAAIYLATAPKSNSLYVAYGNACETIEKTGSLPVPFVIRNAPTNLMKELGYGEGYLYDHDSPEHYLPQDYLPEELLGKKFYQPGNFGFEKEIKKRLDWWEKLKKKFKQEQEKKE